MWSHNHNNTQAWYDRHTKATEATECYQTYTNLLYFVALYYSHTGKIYSKLLTDWDLRKVLLFVCLSNHGIEMFLGIWFMVSKINLSYSHQYTSIHLKCQGGRDIPPAYLVHSVLLPSREGKTNRKIGRGCECCFPGAKPERR